jgi:hypothetical protein
VRFQHGERSCDQATVGTVVGHAGHYSEERFKKALANWEMPIQACGEYGAIF